jgi:hypothetical protein
MVYRANSHSGQFAKPTQAYFINKKAESALTPKMIGDHAAQRG